MIRVKLNRQAVEATSNHLQWRRSHAPVADFEGQVEETLIAYMTYLAEHGLPPFEDGMMAALLKRVEELEKLNAELVKEAWL